MENTLEKVFINRNLGIKFNSYIDHKLRVQFKAKEVATILGYKNTEKAIKSHVSENHKRKILLNQPCDSHGCSMTYFIDEAGFYELVFRSRLPTAKFFREWVFSKVLPSIRKYGYYKFRDTKIKQRVIIDGKKHYKHPVFTNYAARKNGEVINVKNEKIIKMIKFNGYLYFGLSDEKLEKNKNYYQHRFVYEVFRGVIPNCFEIDHINEIKSDNRLKNLQLLTHKQKVEKSNIINICISIWKERRFISIKKASIELDISASNISQVCRKKRKFLTSNKNGNKYIFRYLDQILILISIEIKIYTLFQLNF